MTKAILFDFDGTIAPTLPCWHKAYKQVFLHHGVEFSDDGLTRYLFDGEPCIEADKVERKAHIYEEVCELVTPCVLSTPVTPLLIETISIAQSVRFGIASNSRSALLKEYFHTHSIEKYFEVVVGADGDIPCKPDPTMLLVAMDLLGVSPRETLFVGDALTDMDAGKNAGIETILFTHPQNDIFYDVCENRKYPSNSITSFLELRTRGYV